MLVWTDGSPGQVPRVTRGGRGGSARWKLRGGSGRGRQGAQHAALEIPSRLNNPGVISKQSETSEHMFRVDSGPLMKRAPVKNSLIREKWCLESNRALTEGLAAGGGRRFSGSSTAPQGHPQIHGLAILGTEN